MGSEINTEDLENIRLLAEQVVDFTEYRKQLSDYLRARMEAIAPNLTVLVGELIGARLIAHAGSLINLAKSPASTLQILGAEKALFRALKTKHDTPKYGLIYHASLIGQATGKNKGKIARMLATKAALGLRVDALSDWGTSGEGDKPEPTEEEKMAVGVQGRLLVERRLRGLEGKPIRSTASGVAPNGQAQPAKWEVKEARKYNADADGISANAPAATEDAEMEDVTEAGAEASSDEEEMTKEEKKAAKAAKKAAKEAKKAEKEAKKAAEAAGKSSKKRKHDEDEDKTEKKKKKKSKD